METQAPLLAAAWKLDGERSIANGEEMVFVLCQGCPPWWEGPSEVVCSVLSWDSIQPTSLGLSVQCAAAFVLAGRGASQAQ